MFGPGHKIEGAKKYPQNNQLTLLPFRRSSAWHSFSRIAHRPAVGCSLLHLFRWAGDGEGSTSFGIAGWLWVVVNVAQVSFLLVDLSASHQNRVPCQSNKKVKQCCSAPEQLSKFLFYVCLLLCCTTQQPASQKTLQLLYTPTREIVAKWLG